MFKVPEIGMEPQKSINIRVEFPGKGFPDGLIKGHKDCVDEATAFNYFTQFLGAVRKNPVGTKITFEIVEAPKGTDK